MSNKSISPSKAAYLSIASIIRCLIIYLAPLYKDPYAYLPHERGANFGSSVKLERYLKSGPGAVVLAGFLSSAVLLPQMP